ncbi:MAG: D-alanyl-D-alanine carboxypeptidase/D-alanyl-D-alanine-endopeptidase [Thalassococcus sp.]|uniref:D-alanyl-D-alanine carboxypeptidase/D-alanyl-D-alanine endopeptidase n=1 Tax=Thalassococcus sp. TaxID=1928858 RepID=UPI001B1BC906|nr:D-alanyl-D-alanine carboxypeptidase/D-alanyl-D-alanine-endopeptidase [Thalassococcus sp.]MBO6867632.1 D-alanyl-D-alanine carboxypeptidase/D-alanyl-D-alanine-endopeptidase [Thalassococcus sp.]
MIKTPNTAISRRFFLGTTLAALAHPALAEAPLTSLRPRDRGPDFFRKSIPSAQQLVDQANLGGDVGFSVVNIQTGEVLEAMNAEVALPPASVAKAVTAGYALDSLGPEHVFTTRLLATAPIANGVLDGDLILAGGGDPTLDTNMMADLAARAKAAGLREVRGKFLVWGGALPRMELIDPAQPDHVGYNPAVSGLNLNFNRVHFEWRRSGQGYAVTMDGRSDKYRPDVTISKMRVVQRDLPVYTYASASGYDDWTVARGALGKGGARWLPVRKPELYAGEVFQTMLGAQGVRVKHPQVISTLPETVEVARISSAPLNDILRDMLKYSTNLTAEIVGLAASVARGGQPQTLAQSAGQMNDWAHQGLGVMNLGFVDHSGLGDQSRISAGAMVSTLMELSKSLDIKSILKEVKVRDEVLRRLDPPDIDINAKTGTLNFVSSLAGFCDLPDGTELAFAIFSADTERRAIIPKAERERPRGASSWNGRAKNLQQALLQRWGHAYSRV